MLQSAMLPAAAPEYQPCDRDSADAASAMQRSASGGMCRNLMGRVRTAPAGMFLGSYLPNLTTPSSGVCVLSQPLLHLLKTAAGPHDRRTACTKGTSGPLWPSYQLEFISNGEDGRRAVSRNLSTFDAYVVQVRSRPFEPTEEPTA